MHLCPLAIVYAGWYEATARLWQDTRSRAHVCVCLHAYLCFFRLSSTAVRARVASSASAANIASISSNADNSLSSRALAYR